MSGPRAIVPGGCTERLCREAVRKSRDGGGYRGASRAAGDVLLVDHQVSSVGSC